VHRQPEGITRRQILGNRLIGVAAIVLPSALLVSACNDADSRTRLSTSVTTTTTAQARGPVTDGTSAVDGMRGVTPGAAVSRDFRDRLHAIAPKLDTLSGAAEGYDAVVIAALAAETAVSDAPDKIAARIVDVTTSGDGCASFAACRQSAGLRRDFDYQGESGQIHLLPDGDPATSPFGIVEFNASGALSVTGSTDGAVRRADRPDPPPVTAAGTAADGAIRIATLLPGFGGTRPSAVAAEAGVRLAVDEINGSVGVLGEPIDLVDDPLASADELPDDATVSAAASELISAGVDVVIGGASYDIDRVAVPMLIQAGVVVISPLDTARVLSTIADNGRFFRLAPPTDVIGTVLGHLVTGDGLISVGLATGAGDEDLDLAADVAAAIEDSGGRIVLTSTLSPGIPAETVAQQIVDSGVQAVVVIASTDQAAAIIRAITASIAPDRTIALYGTADNMNEELATLAGSR
jgi:ABC-type branched-subunit amino acid transport system substrate-binding protein